MIRRLEHVRVAVVTPTRLRGGLDVLESSLDRQTLQPVAWLVGDEFLEEREFIYGLISDRHPDWSVYPYRVARRRGMWNNLASTYNAAIQWSRGHAVDLLVSVQDYFWLPDDGLERYAAMMMALPGQMLTGLASIAADPPAEAAVDLMGPYTVFAEPYDGHRPTTTHWPDCRDHEGGHAAALDCDSIGWRHMVQRTFYRRTPLDWELNYAAWPRPVFEQLLFDTAYERGVAYDNQDYAIRALQELGAETWVDIGNHAIGLPHKAYFPEIEAREMVVNNQEFHERKHGTRAHP